jgi:hypothetical protein
VGAVTRLVVFEIALRNGVRCVENILGVTVGVRVRKGDRRVRPSQAYQAVEPALLVDPLARRSEKTPPRSPSPSPTPYLSTPLVRTPPSRDDKTDSTPFSPLTCRSADNTKASIEKSGRQCLQLPLHLEDTSNTQKAIEKHMSKFGRLDILVNNASKQIMCKNLEEIDVSGGRVLCLLFAWRRR